MSELPVATSSTVALTPGVVDFLKLNLFDLDEEYLARLADRLELACVTDPSLAMATEENPQQTAAFRNEVLFLSMMIRVVREDLELIRRCPPDFGNWVKSIEGTSIDNEEIHARLRSALPAPGGARDEEALALGTGRLLAKAGYDRLETYNATVTGNMDTDPSGRLKNILSSAAESCVFSKIGNQFLFQHFRAKLNPERCALLIHGDTPFRHVAQQYDEECNDVTRPVIDTLCGDQFREVDWRTSTDCFDFILAASILREIVDHPIGLLINTEIPFSESFDDEQLFVCTPQFDPHSIPFGVVHNRTLWSTTGTHCICTVLYEFICRRARTLPDSSFSKILECCECDLDSVPSVNPFRKYLY